ncbi:MAG: YaiI/YqxD family protein [Bacilli bacterium]
MKLYIDADACPVIPQTLHIANRFNVSVVLVTDYAHSFDKYDCEKIVVDQGPDAVDWKILQCLTARDVLITQDYGLASLALAKCFATIHPNGWRYTERNIDTLLSSRHLGMQMRKSGKFPKGPKKRKEADNAAFVQCLTIVLEEKLFRP